MRHLEKNMVSDKSYSSDQRARIEGFLKKWRKTSVLCFYFEVLLPVSKLSLALQQEDIDPVKAIDALLTIKDKLIELKEIPVTNSHPFPPSKESHPLTRITTLSVKMLFMKEMEEELVKLSNKQGREFTAAEDIICWMRHSSFLKPIARILNCEAWGES